jgi:TonB family protein
VVPLPDRGAVPRYPDEARRAGREGSVLIRFLVTETGLPDFGSIDVVRGDPDFVTAVLLAVPRMRFRPATVGGCAVRMLVQQPFEFQLQGPPVSPSGNVRGWP